MRKMFFAGCAGLACAASAMGQISITPNGNGNANTTNGRWQVTGVPSTPTSTPTGNATFNATTTGSSDNAFAYHWLWRVNNSAGSTQDTRELVMSNGSGGGANSFLTVTGDNLGNSNTGKMTFDIFNVNNGYTFLAESTYAISNDGSGPRVLNTMKITNRDNGPLSLSLFNYTDFDLAATAGNDTVTWNGVDAFNWVDGATTAQHRALGFSAYQATDFSTSTSSSSLRNVLFNTARNDLNNTVIAGAGDRISGFQYDLVIPAGGMIEVYVGLALNTTAPIPAPGAAALMGLASLAGVRRRR